jgi:hypothetical protein
MQHRTIQQHSKDKVEKDAIITSSLTTPSSPATSLPRARASRLRIRNDQALFAIFLLAVTVVTLSIFLVPFEIQSDPDSHHGIHIIHKVAENVSARVIHERLQHHDAMNEKKKQTEKHDKPLHEVLDESLVQQNQQQSRQDHNKNQSPLQLPDLPDSTPRQSDVKYHVIFSTGCSTYQDWQSYVFFYHLLQSGQQGHVTRIVSGCNDKNAQDLKQIFETDIETMAPGRFHLHLTPDYSKVKPGAKPFKYYNKPFGTRHFFEKLFGYPENHEEHDDTIIILMDPDQILLRPFTNDFSNSSELWKMKGGYKTKVEHGSPFGQQYGFGLQWKDKVTMEHVAAGQYSPIDNMTRAEALNYYYAMGPPYIATGTLLWLM